jgi:hypothetical protein
MTSSHTAEKSAQPRSRCGANKMMAASTRRTPSCLPEVEPGYRRLMAEP